MPKESLMPLTESMFYVLMAFSAGECCGTEAAEYVEKLTAGRVRLGPGTLYAILSKFEKEALIRETVTEGRKRTYKLTPRGVGIYAAELARLECCVEDAKRIR